MPHIKFGPNTKNIFQMDAVAAILRGATILAILNLHVVPVAPTKFQLNLTYDSGGDIDNMKS